MEDNRKNGWEPENGREQANAPEARDRREQNPERCRERETEERLRNVTEGTEIPEALRPEAIEKTLEKKKREKQKSRFAKGARRYGTAAAACLCLAVGIAGVYFLGGDRMSEGGRADYEAESGSTLGLTSGSSGSAETEGEQSALLGAESYDEIYQYILGARDYQEIMMKSYGRGTVEDGAIAENAADEGNANSSSQNGGISYSDTNVRQEGVGEADTVKTDGENLFILTDGRVDIVGIGSEKMEHLAEIQPEKGANVTDIYLENERLVVFYSKVDYEDGDSGNDGSYLEYTCADIYDVSNPSAPERVGGISQSGYYNTMRAKDGYVYVISNFYANVNAARENMSSYIPQVNEKILSASDIFMPEARMGDQYTVISSFALDNPDEKTDTKAVFGTSGMCYVSGENIYITEALYGENGAEVSQTSVRKLSYEEGKLEGIAQTKVDGQLKDSFCIDEYNGYLRIVATVSPMYEVISDGLLPLARFEEDRSEDEAGTAEEQETTSLYVLDKELEITGKIEDLAPGETVYSARFMGDTGYFVTFEQVDPLFSVDLSDPEKPQIIGELKIPGFSEYLHPYGEGLLLGIGMDVDEEGMTTEGVKLSMFDISDPSNVQETEKYVIQDAYGMDIYDYRAVFIDTEKNLFGFTTYGEKQKYRIFSYTPGTGFQEEACWDLPAYGNIRGLYAGERFYLVANNTVVSYTLDGFDKVDDIVF